MDLVMDDNKADDVIYGDICSDNILDGNPGYKDFFDVIYSNGVLEHLKRPWIAAKNIGMMLKHGGVCITVVPFAQKYHEDPVDCFRYTPAGLKSIFIEHLNIQTIVSGFDLDGRRNDWNGKNNPTPVDHFGAWRENWFTVFAFRKI